MGLCCPWGIDGLATLRIVLGDQLSLDLSSLNDARKNEDLILMCEVQAEATYVRHHKKKIAFIFSAMRHHAEALRQQGYQVRYVTLDDPANTGSFSGEVLRALQDRTFEHVVVTFPGEHRVLQELRGLQKTAGVPLEIREDHRFLASPRDFGQWAQGRKQLRMEFFYRDMRKKHGILMNGQEPEGGQWNFDASNRKSPPKNLAIPTSFRVEPDATTQEVIELVAQHFADHFGELEPFNYGVTRQHALQALHRFIEDRLALFGDYQDAMVQGEAWMFHAHISLYLNCGLLGPRETIQAAEAAYKKGKAPLHSVEGFIRQILGWREFVRGLYWLHMPGYAKLNALRATRALPAFYWTAQTPMNCLKQCVQETQRNAYAHHIQRLMILGNFALLAGIQPEQVQQWFLSVYADAYEWVELPNVTGMALYADGGLLASKPYASSASYINKMSDYCQSCTFSASEKNGPLACPFNYLYWDFLHRNAAMLRNNPRLAMIYKSYERFSSDRQTAIKEDSERFLASLD
jgi:deoxyribodipyrimidine photolyase-related protein